MKWVIREGFLIWENYLLSRWFDKSCAIPLKRKYIASKFSRWEKFQLNQSRSVGGRRENFSPRFFQRTQRQREGERKAGNVKDPEKERNEMGAGRRGVRNGGRKGEETPNILLGFVSKNIIRDAGSTAALYLHCWNRSHCFHCLKSFGAKRLLCKYIYDMAIQIYGLLSKKMGVDWGAGVGYCTKLWPLEHLRC